MISRGQLNGSFASADGGQLAALLERVGGSGRGVGNERRAQLYASG